MTNLPPAPNLITAELARRRDVKLFAWMLDTGVLEWRVDEAARLLNAANRMDLP